MMTNQHYSRENESTGKVWLTIPRTTFLRPEAWAVKAEEKKRKKTRGKLSVRKEKKDLLFHLVWTTEPRKTEHEKHRPYYDEEDKELWKHFNEPEWEGILDIVP